MGLGEALLLPENVATLANILTYHVVPGMVMVGMHKPITQYF